MAHILDRPVWQALSTCQSAWAEGGDKARRFALDVSPLAGARDEMADSLQQLTQIASTDPRSLLLQVSTIPASPGILIERTAAAVQLTDTHVSPDIPDAHLVRLGDEDAAEMVALATLTEPGPFLPRTHILGDFWGIKSGGRLAAMAGERLRLDGYTEVSGVCTHPDFRGRGYARLLSQAVAATIKQRGEIPFLHTYAENAPAIRLYESLGFALRAEMIVTVLRRA
ncbi:MAG: GNAT family N-acetyltransferase [Sphingosinicella sp.]|nr:GNAT family N-acetyltransferase [Sphingosinicella sp.]